MNLEHDEYGHIEEFSTADQAELDQEVVVEDEEPTQADLIELEQTVMPGLLHLAEIELDEEVSNNHAISKSKRPSKNQTPRRRRRTPKEEGASNAHLSSDDIVGQYFHEIAQTPLLTSEQEVSLSIRILRGQKELHRMNTASSLSDTERAHIEEVLADAQEAREALAGANTQLVVSIAKRYMNRGLPFPDLVQEGNLGLMRAVDKYDHTRGNRFSTYATWWIRQSITRALSSKSRTIRLSVHMVEDQLRLAKIRKRLEQELGRKPSFEDLVQEGTYSRARLEAIDKANKLSMPVEMDRRIGTDSTSDEVGDFIADPEVDDPEKAAFDSALSAESERMLSRLTERHKRILRMRFGFETGEEMTLEEIAQEEGISRERVRQIEAKALRTLKDPFKLNPKLSRAMKEFLR